MCGVVVTHLHQTASRWRTWHGARQPRSPTAPSGRTAVGWPCLRARGGGEWSRSVSRSSAGGVCRCRCWAAARGSGAAERSPSRSEGTAPKPPRGENWERLDRPVNKTLAREMGFGWWVVLSSCGSCVIPRAPGRLIPGAGAVVVVVPAQIKHACAKSFCLLFSPVLFRYKELQRSSLTPSSYSGEQVPCGCQCFCLLQHSGGLEEEFCRNCHFSVVEAAVEVGSVTEARLTGAGFSPKNWWVGKSFVCRLPGVFCTCPEFRLPLSPVREFLANFPHPKTLSWLAERGGDD